jgi:hypothetical protein
MSQSLAGMIGAKLLHPKASEPPSLDDPRAEVCDVIVLSDSDLVALGYIDRRVAALRRTAICCGCRGWLALIVCLHRLL